MCWFIKYLHIAFAIMWATCANYGTGDDGELPRGTWAPRIFPCGGWRVGLYKIYVWF